jgi:hypothetical protein
MHVIFGTKDASEKGRVRLRKKGDLFYSASNFNLLIDEDQDELGLGALISRINFGTIWRMVEAEGDHEPIKLLEDDLSGWCSRCRKTTGVACALFENPAAGLPADASMEQASRSRLWASGSADLSLCSVVQRLLDMTETATERKFYDLYFRYVLARTFLRPSVREVMHGAYSGAAYAGWTYIPQPGEDIWFMDLHGHLIDLLDPFPALIPQVILNFVPGTELSDDHPDKMFYDWNVGRVDFLFLRAGVKHIVEIDGPYHHRTDAEYTRLLRRDRSLRREGFAVHRFSNMEVTQATDFTSFAQELFSGSL